MKSLARKPERDLDMSVPMAPEYPTVYISGEVMPEINSWEVGKEYVITVKVRMRDFSKEETIDRTSSHACLELLEYEEEESEEEEGS